MPTKTAFQSDRAVLNSFYEWGKPTGNILYVHHTGTSTGPGFSPESPYSTIDAAINACVANNGDVVVVLPGHAETVAAAAGFALDIAGVRVIGQGVGENRPVVTFATSTAATCTISGADCVVENIVFKCDIDSQVVAVPITGAGSGVVNCEFLEGTAKQMLIAVDLGEDRTFVTNSYFKSVAAGANSAIKISAAKDRIRIVGNEVFGDYADAAIHNPTGNVATRVLIADNILTNLQSGDHAIELVSACTGVIKNNIVNSTLAAIATRTAIDPGSCYCIENYGSDGVGDVSGVLNPVADS
jgi:hypothetical protein